MLQAALALLVERQQLPAETMRAAMQQIMQGQGTEAEVAAFLTALRVKGETADELATAVSVLRQHMVHLDHGARAVVDTCGTGGDGSGTFNISTAAALVTAACGVPVVKHGNRGVSSSSGSSDVLTALGVKVDVDASVVSCCLSETSFGFCFAPRFHPAMRHVAEVRKRLRFRTMFNLMGPLCNPAGARFQLIGVGRPELLDLLGESLRRLGTESAFVVHGEDGLDEVTLSGRTFVRQVCQGSVSALEWQPGDFGLSPGAREALLASGPKESADRIVAVLAGELGPARDVVLANAAAVLLAARRVDSLRAGVELGASAIVAGKAREVLERLRFLSQQP
jgi:anthranilate phosphoribosyltransferase